MDHISGVPHHAHKRSLYGQKPATYYVPSEVVQPLQDIGKLYAQMAETSFELNIKTIEPSQQIRVTFYDIVEKK